MRRRYAVLVDGFAHRDFERGDFDAFFEWLDPEIEWRGPPEFPDLAELRFGHEGVREYVTILLEAIEDYRMVPEEFIDAGDDRTIRNGKAIRLRSYWERADALEAVGLRD